MTVRKGLVGLVGCGLLLAGCGTSPDYKGAPPVVEFDYVNMQIRLPLDEYGMTAVEQRLLHGARLVEYRSCMVDASIDPAWLDPDELITDALTRSDDLMPDWRFGFWNADYVAEHGIEGPSSQDGEEKQPVSSEHEAALKDLQSPYNQAWEQCADSGSVEFVWVGRGVVSPRWEILGKGWLEPYFKAEDDTRWKAAKKEKRDCMTAKGYKVLDDSFAELPEDATEEAEAKAFVDDAKCADELGTAKKLAEIEAEYQMDYIKEHEAELVEIQKRTRELVAQAVELVEGAGFTWQS